MKFPLKAFTSKSSDEYFQTNHLQSDLKRRTVRGGAATVAATVSRFVIRLASNLLLARLLTPIDYGLFGMVTVITSFIELFRGLGLSEATVQRAEINHHQSSTLFWICASVGLGVSVLVAALAPLIALFYNEPRLIAITLALAPNFFISSFGGQHAALLRRQMQFSTIARIEVIAFGVATLLGIILALRGFSYWSLVFMQTAEVTTTVVAYWIACGWRPGLPKRGCGVRSMMAFGGNLTAFRGLVYITRNLDNLLIGRFWGAYPLGLYSKAYQLLLLPIQQINTPVTNVAIPALSSLQNQPDKYRSFYKNAILSITFLGMPIVALNFAIADELILFILGEKWVDAAPLFRYLMPAAFAGTFNVATGWAFQSLGRTDKQLRWGLVYSSITAIVFAIAVRWGASGVAIGYGIAQPILAFCGIAYCYRGTPLKLRDLLSTLFKPVVASLGAMLVLIAIKQLYSEQIGLMLTLAIDVMAYGLLYFGIWLILPGGKSTLIKLLSELKNLKSKKAK